MVITVDLLTAEGEFLAKLILRYLNGLKTVDREEQTDRIEALCSKLGLRLKFVRQITAIEVDR